MNLFDTELRPASLEPLISSRALGAFPLVGTTLSQLLEARLLMRRLEGEFSVALWPSDALLEQMGNLDNWIVREGERVLAFCGNGGAEIMLDNESVVIRYPWDLLRVHELILTKMTLSQVDGVVREYVVNDGILILGEGSVLLPGVYTEGVVMIGKNCRIGPNCYIRGATSIGDGCHIGQAVEIKNSIVMSGTAIGHLSYFGDSILGMSCNAGAGTVSSNFRHDGMAHFSVAAGQCVNTGRRKLGTFWGDGVHTGIHTAIYPGRKIGSGGHTLPGEVVKYDKEL